MKLSEMDRSTLLQMKTDCEEAFAAYKARGLKLNMARGKPSQAQLELTRDMYEPLDGFADSTGEDTRNYGSMTGIPEARRLMGQMLGVPADQVIVGGSSSLNLMYDTLCRAWIHGVGPDSTPWCAQGPIRFLCPSPGYDRHFAVSASFGIENIPIPMTVNGPDMDVVERLVQDPSVKGLWCVPQYSNPDGYTCSEETVRRFAALKPAAPDFRIFWDNAYGVHHLYPDRRDQLLNLYEECVKQGSEDLAYYFCSTSKITAASAGMAAVGMSKRNFDWTCKWMSIQTIGYDRISQLRHTRYLKDMDNIAALMEKHAALLRPKFDLVLSMLEKELAPLGVGFWHVPKGGYFISFFGANGTAKRIVSLCAEAGVVLTGAGATYPYGKDQTDSNIRLSPSFPPLEELQQAMEIFCLAAKLATLENLLG